MNGKEGDAGTGLHAAGWISGLRIGLKNDWMGVDLAEITKKESVHAFFT
ncbi:MAG: hypothetical protein IKH28_03775 [Lachnospiraceae bacterium]|nr:hypothetical protein [Lachnospiraceae bacterium]